LQKYETTHNYYVSKNNSAPLANFNDIIILKLNAITYSD